MEDLTTKYSEKVLRFFIKKMKETYDFTDSPFFDWNRDEIDNVLNSMGISVKNYEDYGFWGYLVVKNKDNDPSTPLTLPKASRYKVYIDISERVWQTVSVVHRIDTYGDDEKSVRSQVNNDENFDFWDGTTYDTNTYDSETDDWAITEVEKVNLNESYKKEKRLVENYQNNLDEIIKLQKLKIKIEERLKLLSP